MEHDHRWSATNFQPPGFAGLGLAHYRLLLPLAHEHEVTFRPWARFLPGGDDRIEVLRDMDLYDLRQVAREAGVDMAGWDSARDQVSADYVTMLGEALREFVARDASWTLVRWRGHRHHLAGAQRMRIGELDCEQTVHDLPGALQSIRELGMPEYLRCSTGQFG